MDVERDNGKATVHLEGRERFAARLINGMGNTRILVDTVIIESVQYDREGSALWPASFTISGGLKNLFFGYSKKPDEQTGETTWGGPEPYEDLMRNEVYVALQAIANEIHETKN